MPVDFTNIKPTKIEALPIKPVELFQKLKVKDPLINDLWLAQGDALRKWDENRDKIDIGIVLNTGAGKTLVGLLIAQSLTNETKGKVLYICSSIQLIEQTVEKADGYGLKTTTYYKREFNNDLYDKCVCPCITTYQAIFNGKSRFFHEDISAIIFDDAHTAEHLLRDHFSLNISKNTFSNLYSSIVELFRDYHQKIGKSGSYEELLDDTSNKLFLIPPFEIKRQFNELIRILNEAKLSIKTDTTFSWEYIKDKVDLCAILISNNTITITPPFIPTRVLPYFINNIRRIYLSATLVSSDAFTRTFGRKPDLIIIPETTAGECERLILMPSRTRSIQNEIEVAKKAIEHKKALILVPTYTHAEKWKDFALLPEKENVTTAINEFKSTTSQSKLLLAARYDGIDLPGDTCRVMVIDDLPMGVGQLEKYLWEYLRLSNSLRSTIASRIVQSFGRISRGMSDHGVVLITGEKLIKWLITPRDVSLLPKFLQKQISLGYEISNQIDNAEELTEIIEKCLNRDEQWVSAYKTNMQDTEALDNEGDLNLLTKIAMSEADFGLNMWNRDYASAAKCFVMSLTDAFLASSSTGAWHSLWLGLAYDCLGDSDKAIEMYKQSHAIQKTIPPLPSIEDDKSDQNNIPVQVIEVDRQFKINNDGSIILPKSLFVDLAHLNGSGSPKQTEESLRALGQYLGMNSSRPDNEYGTGPDVLWLSSDKAALCIEVKTDKSESSNYQKKEIGQLADHTQWVKDTYSIENIIPIFVGPIVPATEPANPPPNFKVIKLEQFNDLASRLKATLNDVKDEALHITLRSTLLDFFQKRNLLWPDCFDTLKSFVLRDL